MSTQWQNSFTKDKKNVIVMNGAFNVFTKRFISFTQVYISYAKKEDIKRKKSALHFFSSVIISGLSTEPLPYS